MKVYLKKIAVTAVIWPKFACQLTPSKGKLVNLKEKLYINNNKYKPVYSFTFFLKKISSFSNVVITINLFLNRVNDDLKSYEKILGLGEILGSPEENTTVTVEHTTFNLKTELFRI